MQKFRQRRETPRGTGTCSPGTCGIYRFLKRHFIRTLMDDFSELDLTEDRWSENDVLMLNLCFSTWFECIFALQKLWVFANSCLLISVFNDIRRLSPPLPPPKMNPTGFTPLFLLHRSTLYIQWCRNCDNWITTLDEKDVVKSETFEVSKTISKYNVTAFGNSVL
jgi:hypothetical protein